MWWRRDKKEVTEFLYKLLVAEAPSKGYAREVAERMGVPYPTLSKYWLGKRRFPASLVNALFLATDQDGRVADFFLLDNTDYRLERREGTCTASDVSRAVLTVSELAGTVSGLYLRATAATGESGQTMSAADTEKLAAATRLLVRSAEELRMALSDGKSQPG